MGPVSVTRVTFMDVTLSCLKIRVGAFHGSAA